MRFSLRLMGHRLLGNPDRALQSNAQPQSKEHPDESHDSARVQQPRRLPARPPRMIGLSHARNSVRRWLDRGCPGPAPNQSPAPLTRYCHSSHRNLNRSLQRHREGLTDHGLGPMPVWMAWSGRPRRCPVVIRPAPAVRLGLVVPRHQGCPGVGRHRADVQRSPQR